VSKAVYDSEKEEACFDYTFEEDTELTGYMKLRLFVEAESYNDMDLFINIQKLSTTGEFLPVTVFGEPHPGVWGKMRASRRKLDEDLSTDYCPVQAHTCDEKLKPGEIVPVDIEIVPTSRFWHKGQKIRVQIAGRYIREGWFEPLIWNSDNKGRHIIHTGNEYESYLQIPVIPPKFRDGEIIIR
jgi:predicted acyl esterase